jgi:hypothetical protein
MHSNKKKNLTTYWILILLVFFQKRKLLKKFNPWKGEYLNNLFKHFGFFDSLIVGSLFDSLVESCEMGGEKLKN